MNLLLDTHVFIWWASDPSKLTAQALALCEDPLNTLILSVASVWEMQIKLQLGKLALQTALPDLIEAQRRTNGITILPVELEHVIALARLPTPHKDPFDRILVAQALVASAALLSADQIFTQYPIQLLGGWA